ncbi:hypothetical protein [Cellulomonas marina]|uniref:hypothetical protein n=1 Tax=Cellulomonas marina TaxID=988821 RepID=UPI000B7E579A|nr:hypothetical protein [Cellulomonas marina]
MDDERAVPGEPAGPTDVAALAAHWGVELLGPHAAQEPPAVRGRPTRTAGGSWAARSTTGERLVLHLVPVPPPAHGEEDRALGAAQALVGVVHEDVVDVRAAARLGPTHVALLTAQVAGPDLTSLLDARAPLDPGEAATVALRLALALAVLHGRGLTVGDLTGAAVVVRPDGLPVLADLRGCLSSAASAADDVRALVRTVLTHAAPATGEDAALASALRQVGAAAAPSTGAVAAACGRLGAGTAVRLPDPALLAREALRSAAGPSGPGPAAPGRAAVGRRRRAVRPRWSAGPGATPPTTPLRDLPRDLPHDLPHGLPYDLPHDLQRDRPHGLPRDPRRGLPGALPARGSRRPGPGGTGSTPRGDVRRSRRRGRLLGLRVPTIGVALVTGLAVVLAASTGSVLAARDAVPARAAAGAHAATPDGTRTAPGGADGAVTPVDEGAVEAADVGAVAAARDLTLRRAAVLAGSAGSGTAVLDALAEVEVRDGPAWSSDADLLRRLEGVVLRGYGVDVLEATAVPPGTTVVGPVDASVLVRARTDAYERVVGGVVEAVAAPPDSAVVLDLVRTDDGWRVWSVREDTAG